MADPKNVFRGHKGSLTRFKNSINDFNIDTVTRANYTFYKQHGNAKSQDRRNLTGSVVGHTISSARGRKRGASRTQAYRRSGERSSTGLSLCRAHLCNAEKLQYLESPPQTISNQLKLYPGSPTSDGPHSNDPPSHPIHQNKCAIEALKMKPTEAFRRKKIADLSFATHRVAPGSSLSGGDHRRSSSTPIRPKERSPERKQGPPHHRIFYTWRVSWRRTNHYQDRHIAVQPYLMLVEDGHGQILVHGKLRPLQENSTRSLHLVRVVVNKSLSRHNKNVPLRKRTPRRPLLPQATVEKQSKRHSAVVPAQERFGTAYVSICTSSIWLTGFYHRAGVD
ncbi:unnamed protein product [Allacma fusca]|uniref:Uncharacterized protein n=1 Tax=Allacma fusca TaxID=39272 RepID=A0A8J2P4Z3_9HEXA|nr:unnamed protein product [Allacma fusca]